ncbi:hypothetical protein [Saccharothrix deserti]|nr:hypothetical protein [Saccharothrix deserti]
MVAARVAAEAQEGKLGLLRAALEFATRFHGPGHVVTARIALLTK